MTTLHFSKNSLLLFSFLLVAFLGFISCNNTTQNKKDSEEVAEDMNKPASDATKESDERFLVRAAEINLEEVKLGQLAQQKAVNEDVKSLAKMMTDGHGKAMTDLSTLAASKSIAVPAVPTNDVQDVYQRLSEKTGNDFDKEYCDRVVKGHKDAISLYENATTGNNDPDVKAWANKILPDLRAHLQHAEMCEQKLKNM